MGNFVGVLDLTAWKEVRKERVVCDEPEVLVESVTVKGRFCEVLISDSVVEVVVEESEALALNVWCVAAELGWSEAVKPVV